MAIPLVSRDCKIVIAEQPTWGTVIAGSGAWIQMDCELFDLPTVLNWADNPGATGARFRLVGDKTVDTYGIITEFVLKGNLKIKEAALLFAGYFQKVTEGASSPYSKVFDFGTSAPQPDFPVSNAGWTFSIGFVEKSLTDSFTAKDCVVKSLKIDFKPGGRATFEATIRSRGIIASADFTSATYTRNTSDLADFWYWAKCARKTVNFGAGAVAQDIGNGGLSITFDQAVDPYGQESNGDVTGYVIYDRYPKVALNFLKGSNLASAFTNLRAKTPIDIVLGWGNATPGTVHGDLDITCQVVLMDVKRVLGSNLYEIAMEGEMASDDNTTSPVTVTMADTQDKGW